MYSKKHYILMGHNRHATQGAIVAENSHPFEYQHIIGAHNGSLYSGWKSSLFEAEKYVVDSAALYSELNQHGVEALWGKLDGPAALTWIDKRDGSINFLRNHHRPLWWTTANKGTTLLWASEPWMLHVSSLREGVDLDEAPREVALNTHYKFDVPTKWGGKVSHTRTSVEPYTPPKRESWKSSWGYSDLDNRKYLKSEGLEVGDSIEFTVNRISDYYESGRLVCSISGKSLNGSPVTAYQVDSSFFEDILMEMWELDGMVFTAKIKTSTSYGLIFDMNTAVCVNFTLDDIAEAEKRQEKENEQRKLDNEIKLLAASLEGNNKLQ